MGKAPFRLERSDIGEYWNGHYASLMGATIRLVHMPTGVEVKGEVPQIHKTKGKLRAAEDKLRQELIRQLTDLVAKHLRISGR